MSSSDTTMVINVQTYDGSTIIIYNNRKPDVYQKSDIYDPDDPQSGKYFPSLNSIVIDTDGSLWYVASRDESTYRVTLKPCTFISTEETNVKIISYGNDKFCLYQDTRTNPHKLVVDAKLLFYGNNLQEYILYRYDDEGNEVSISMYFDNTDTFVSNRIPMQYISDDYPSYKWPTNCHTTWNLTEGEPILLRVFNNLGNVAAEITIFVRNAIWLNDLASQINPIVSLDATCLQMRGEDFYIYPRQNPSELNILPYLTYSDGTRKFINIDNMQCFLYGIDNYLPSYPGYSQKIMIKYFLSYKEQALDPIEIGSTRFLTCTKNLVVVSNTNSYTAKLSVIPVYDRTALEWTLRFFAYTDQRNITIDATDISKLADTDIPFDGSSAKWGVEQVLTVEYNLQSVFDTDDELQGAQSFCITLWDPDNTYERYTIREAFYDDHIYGVDGSVTRRPIIHYDHTLQQYYIPTSIFGNWDAVVESFYHLAKPPYNPITETTAPTPTHFTVRDVYGKQIIANPIAADEYGQAWSTIQGTDTLDGQVVVVEFLQESNDTYLILYGVPVDVKLSTTGYNG